MIPPDCRHVNRPRRDLDKDIHLALKHHAGKSADATLPHQDRAGRVANNFAAGRDTEKCVAVQLREERMQRKTIGDFLDPCRCARLRCCRLLWRHWTWSLGQVRADLMPPPGMERAPGARRCRLLFKMFLNSRLCC